MNQLWAPWRKAYIRHKNRRFKGCLFCKLLKENRDVKNYIVKRNSHCFAILNLYPYNNGHLLILPKRHVASVEQLNDAERLDWLRLYDEMVEALKKTLKPHGFNAGINFGRIAGAGIPGHLHLHIVPRWKGDSNFMPSVAQTKVISESLDSVYEALAKILKKKSKKS